MKRYSYSSERLLMKRYRYSSERLSMKRYRYSSEPLSMKHWWSVRFCERLLTKHWRSVRHNVLVNVYRWNTELGVYGTTSESLLVIHWTGRRVVAVLPHQMMYFPKELCTFRHWKEKRTFRQSNDVLSVRVTMYSPPKERCTPAQTTQATPQRS